MGALFERGAACGSKEMKSSGWGGDVSAVRLIGLEGDSMAIGRLPARSHPPPSPTLRSPPQASEPQPKSALLPAIPTPTTRKPKPLQNSSPLSPSKYIRCKIFLFYQGGNIEEVELFLNFLNIFIMKSLYH